MGLNPPAPKKSREDFMSDIRVLATDLEFPEGPVVMPDGSVVLVEIRGRRLTRVWPDGSKEVVAEIPGGPNGAAIGPDGKCYICNNGGVSWDPPPRTLMPGAPPPHQYNHGVVAHGAFSSPQARKHIPPICVTTTATAARATVC